MKDHISGLRTFKIDFHKICNLYLVLVNVNQYQFLPTILI